MCFSEKTDTECLNWRTRGTKTVDLTVYCISWVGVAVRLSSGIFRRGPYFRFSPVVFCASPSVFSRAFSAVLAGGSSSSQQLPACFPYHIHVAWIDLCKSNHSQPPGRTTAHLHTGCSGPPKPSCGPQQEAGHSGTKKKESMTLGEGWGGSLFYEISFQLRI